MTLFPYQRLAYLYDVISNERLPQQELANRFAVSARTIRTDVILLNEILDHYHAKISYKKGVGYEIIVHDEKLYATFLQQRNQLKPLPRSGQERVLNLLITFLTQTKAIKLDDVAEEWFISRSTIQSDMVAVKEYIEKYGLSFQNRPYQGVRIIGEESSIRACLTDILWQFHTAEDNHNMQKLQQRIITDIDLNALAQLLHNQFIRFKLTLTREGDSYLCYSFAVSLARMKRGQPLLHCPTDPVNGNIIAVTAAIAEQLTEMSGISLSDAEFNYFCAQINFRSTGGSATMTIEIQQKTAALIDYLLNYINQHYHYDMRSDARLCDDLFVHISSMLARIKYHIHTTNPLLNEVKQYYPFAYDISLAAIKNTKQYQQSPLTVSLTDDEIGYLAVHIGVALERNFSVHYQRQPTILLVSELSNATLNLLEFQIKKDFPQINMTKTISCREYEQLSTIDQDFIVTTVRLSEKDKPIVKISPFPTEYQLAQLGRLVMIDRTMPYILERFFDERFFLIINEPLDKSQLFNMVTQKLSAEGFVDLTFFDRLAERESIGSTLLGENIAIPHTVGLVAKKTVVVTLLMPNGILWDKNEVANVIFLLAISKDEYEDAMGIYNLFVNFIKEKSTKRILNSQSFLEFQSIVKDSFARIA
ncbi:PRD domain-containing protein [Orbaceae bacterium ESL0727]|nr:PRD domain-containing protein [Orbaceae bacterium ESL0727]